MNISNIGTQTLFCTVTNKAGSVNSRIATLTIGSPIPSKDIFSKSSKLIPEDAYNWRMEIYEAGIFTPPRDMEVDVFLVGGGGGGGAGSASGGGGGGGYAQTYRNLQLIAHQPYPIVIGAGGAQNSRGGTSSAFGKQTEGGYPGGSYVYSAGGNGGSGGGAGFYNAQGGKGGSNGGNGANVTAEYNDRTYTAVGGQGQGTTTYAFEDSSLSQYAGGGGGGHWKGAGGEGGGGTGGHSYVGSSYGWAHGTDGLPNTGGGGGGGGESTNGGTGGSGIVIVRNAR